MMPAASHEDLHRSIGTSIRTQDRRGRFNSAPPILHYGFRPFFFLAAVDAALMVPAWLLAYRTGAVLPGPFEGTAWHAHEMLFGYLMAVIAGFTLTAVPNWTGRLPLSGRPLAVLVALWIVGRLASAFLEPPVASAILDLAFPGVLALAVWREIIAGRNWRNLPVVGLLTMFGAANLLQHLEAAEELAPGLGSRVALAAAVMMIALVGGRIVPSFTRNWLVKQGAAALPAPFGMFDKFALATTAAAVTSWLARPDLVISGPLLVLAGAALATRLARWRGAATIREPIVAILHLGYLWLCLALLLMGAAILLPSVVPTTAALHALTAGAIGTMTLAVMTRASLGHTRRAIRADAATLVIYSLVTIGALLRVAAPFSDSLYLPVLEAGGALWSAAFLLFAARYGPILWGPLPTIARTTG